MVLDFFGRNGLFSAFILLGIVGISAQQSGGRSANRNRTILLKVVDFEARSRKFVYIHIYVEPFTAAILRFSVEWRINKLKVVRDRASDLQSQLWLKLGIPEYLSRNLKKKTRPRKICRSQISPSSENFYIQLSLASVQKLSATPSIVTILCP